MSNTQSAAAIVVDLRAETDWKSGLLASVANRFQDDENADLEFAGVTSRVEVDQARAELMNLSEELAWMLVGSIRVGSPVSRPSVLRSILESEPVAQFVRFQLLAKLGREITQAESVSEAELTSLARELFEQRQRDEFNGPY